MSGVGSLTISTKLSGWWGFFSCYMGPLMGQRWGSCPTTTITKCMWASSHWASTCFSESAHFWTHRWWHGISETTSIRSDLETVLHAMCFRVDCLLHALDIGLQWEEKVSLNFLFLIIMSTSPLQISSLTWWAKLLLRHQLCRFQLYRGCLSASLPSSQVGDTWGKRPSTLRVTCSTTNVCCWIQQAQLVMPTMGFQQAPLVMSSLLSQHCSTSNFYHGLPICSISKVFQLIVKSSTGNICHGIPKHSVMSASGCRHTQLRMSTMRSQQQTYQGLGMSLLEGF